MGDSSVSLRSGSGMGSRSRSAHELVSCTYPLNPAQQLDPLRPQPQARTLDAGELDDDANHERATLDAGDNASRLSPSRHTPEPRLS